MIYIMITLQVPNAYIEVKNNITGAHLIKIRWDYLKGIFK